MKIVSKQDYKIYNIFANNLVQILKYTSRVPSITHSRKEHQNFTDNKIYKEK